MFFLLLFVKDFGTETSSYSCNYPLRDTFRQMTEKKYPGLCLTVFEKAPSPTLPLCRSPVETENSYSKISRPISIRLVLLVSLSLAATLALDWVFHKLVADPSVGSLAMDIRYWISYYLYIVVYWTRPMTKVTISSSGIFMVDDSYGRKCNSRFFLNYGFALPDTEEETQHHTVMSRRFFKGYKSGGRTKHR